MALPNLCPLPAVRSATQQEWTDVASREAAGPYLQQLLALDPTAEAAAAAAGDGMQLAGAGGDGAFEGAVAALLLAVESSPAGFSCAMLDGLASLAAAAGLLGKPGFSGHAAGDSARFSGERVAGHAWW
jgi:hypothetical protein